MARNQINVLTGELHDEPNVLVSRAGNTYATFALSVKQPRFGEYGTNEMTDVIEFLCFGVLAQRLEDSEAGDLLTVQFNVSIDENEGNEGQIFRNVKLMVNDFLPWGELKAAGPLIEATAAARVGVAAGVVSNDELIRIDKDGNHHFNLRLTVAEEFKRRRREGETRKPGEEREWVTEVRESEWPFRGVPELLGPHTAASNLGAGDVVMVHYSVIGSTWETRDGAERISNHLYANAIVPFDGSPPEVNAAPAEAAEPAHNGSVDDLPWE